MGKKIDTTCESIRLRLIAAAVGLQQCTKTAANVVPLPGTKRFITIGTPAEVVALLRREVPNRGPIIGEGDGAALLDALGDWMTQSVLHPETNLPEDVAALFGACGFEIRSTDPAEKHPFAVCGSLDAAGLLVETVLTELGQGDPEAVPAEFVALLPGVAYMDPPDGGSVSVLEQFRRMAKDAARYRWLRNEAYHDARDSQPFIAYGSNGTWGECGHVQLDGESADASIDAARTKEGGAS